MNIIINSSAWQERDLFLIFQNEDVIFVDEMSIPQLLKHLGVFPSTSKAVQAGKTGEIPKGYTEYRASKKCFLYIWNPTE